jgi:hypothetical protein
LNDFELNFADNVFDVEGKVVFKKSLQKLLALKIANPNIVSKYPETDFKDVWKSLYEFPIS